MPSLTRNSRLKASAPCTICQAAWSLAVEPTESRRWSKVYSRASSICLRISSSLGRPSAEAAALALTGVVTAGAPDEEFAVLQPLAIASPQSTIQMPTKPETRQSEVIREIHRVRGRCVGSRKECLTGRLVQPMQCSEQIYPPKTATPEER